MLIFVIFFTKIHFFSKYNINEFSNHQHLINNIDKDILWVHNCFFEDLSNRAINAINSGNNFIIEYCYFYNCSCSSGNGGAIYLNDIYGQPFIRFCCALKCYTPTSTNFGQFIYLSLSNNQKIEFNYSTIIKCSPFIIGDRRSNVYFNYGFINVIGINSTLNNCKYHSSIRLESSEIKYLTFSTFVSNFAYGYHGLYIVSGSKFFDKLNIVNNSQSLTSGGIVVSYSPSNLIIYSSIFINNYIKLFYVVNSNIQIYNSLIDNYSGPVTIFSTIITSNTFSLYHFNSFNCYAQNQINYSIDFLFSLNSYKLTNILFNFLIFVI